MNEVGGAGGTLGKHAWTRVNLGYDDYDGPPMPPKASK